MSATYLEEIDLRELGLKNGQRMESTYVMNPNGNDAYGYATRRLGFSNPISTDEDYATKQFWLIEMMTLYFYHDQLRKHTPKFDVEGIKLSQVAKMLRTLINDIEKLLDKAKDDIATAAIFISEDAAAAMFSDTIVDSGIRNDHVGDYYTSIIEGE